MKNSQFTRKLSDSKTGIGDHLRQFINNLSVDVWGIEKRIGQHALEYFQKISKEENLPQDQLSLCLTHTCSTPTISLYQRDVLYKVVRTSELLEFLGISALVPEKIDKQITSYFNALSTQCKITISEIVLKLSVRDQQVILRAYRNTQFLSSIKIRELLNYFHP